MHFKDKVIVITGGSKGIGKCMAQNFAKDGAKLAICARHKDALDKTADELKKLTDVLAIKADVSNESDVREFVKKTINKFKKIDIFISNAALLSNRNTLENTSLEEWNNIINVNLTGAFICAKEALKIMKKQGYGHIINVSSGLGKRGMENMGAYCASKFGLEGFNEVLALETKKYNVLVNSLCINSIVLTDGVKKNFPEFLKNSMPSITPQKVADATLELAKSKETGQCFMVNV